MPLRPTALRGLLLRATPLDQCSPSSGCSPDLVRGTEASPCPHRAGDSSREQDSSPYPIPFLPDTITRASGTGFCAAGGFVRRSRGRGRWRRFPETGWLRSAFPLSALIRRHRPPREKTTWRARRARSGSRAVPARRAACRQMLGLLSPRVFSAARGFQYHAPPPPRRSPSRHRRPPRLAADVRHRLPPAC